MKRHVVLMLDNSRLWWSGWTRAGCGDTQACSTSPPGPVEVGLLRKVLRLAAATRAAGRLTGRSTGLKASRAAAQHLQLILLQPHCFTCASQHPSPHDVPAFTSCLTACIAEMPSEDKCGSMQALHDAGVCIAGRRSGRRTGCELGLWPVLLHPLVGLCESPPPVFH